MPRRTSSPPPQSPPMTRDHIERSIRRLNARIQDLEQFDPSTLRKRWAPEAKALETSIEQALGAVFGEGTPDFRRYQRAASLDHGPVRIIPGGGGGMRDDSREAQRYVAEGKHESLLLLRQAVRSLEEMLADLEPTHAAASAAPGKAVGMSAPTKVFIVHGRDDGTKETIARFVEQLELEAIILHERPNRGRTLITKFREEAEGVGFAIVLMTPDDLGKAKDAGGDRPRARQNVVLELGFFIGALGPARVAAVVRGDIERPSDLDGVVYISFDREDWRTTLARELRDAGFHFDPALVLGR